MKKQRVITAEAVQGFERKLRLEKKSRATMEYYLRTARRLVAWLDGRPADRGEVLAWTEDLRRRGYKDPSVNTLIAAANRFLDYLGLEDCRARNIRCKPRRRIDLAGMELEKEELARLVATAEEADNRRLALVLVTLSSTGLRVSELRHITVETVRARSFVVEMKGVSREVLITDELSGLLLPYAAERGIETGPIFITKSGHTMDRSNIWKEMKDLCRQAGVDEKKVFPRNLRQLFTRSFYGIDRDLDMLADVLGHSGANATRTCIVGAAARQRAVAEGARAPRRRRRSRRASRPKDGDAAEETRQS